MTDQDKARLQNAALQVAEHLHSQEDAVKPIHIKVNELREVVRKKGEELKLIQRDLQVEVMNLRKALLPYIPEDLRD